MMGNVLRWLILVVVVLGAGGVLYYEYDQRRPCAHPITYSIGAVDPRFGVTANQLKSDLSAAAKIWDKVAGRTLFTYGATGTVKVNLIYDEREASAKLGMQIAMAQASADSVRVSIDAEHASIDAAQAALNEEVHQINANGGATPAERAQIIAEQQALAARIASLNSEVDAFNASIKAMNVQVTEFNQTAGHLFQEGEYVRDAKGERINIFEFVGNDQLERVLAHELGHAVGLNHNSDPNSIMYANNESGNLKPTTMDVKDLKALCGLN
jgi:prefoldin subunit 5